MAKENTVVKINGISFFGLLAIVFITLKLTGHITWSWWWVTAPLWGPTVVVLSIGLGLLIFAGLCFLGAALWASKD